MLVSNLYLGVGGNGTAGNACCTAMRIQVPIFIIHLNPGRVLGVEEASVSRLETSRSLKLNGQPALGIQVQ